MWGVLVKSGETTAGVTGGGGPGVCITVYGGGGRLRTDDTVLADRQAGEAIADSDSGADVGGLFVSGGEWRCGRGRKMTAGMVTVITLQVITILLLIVVVWSVATRPDREEREKKDELEVSDIGKWPDHTKV